MAPALGLPSRVRCLAAPESPRKILARPQATCGLSRQSLHTVVRPTLVSGSDDHLAQAKRTVRAYSSAAGAGGGSAQPARPDPTGLNNNGPSSGRPSPFRGVLSVLFGIIRLALMGAVLFFALASIQNCRSTEEVLVHCVAMLVLLRIFGGSKLFNFFSGVSFNIVFGIGAVAVAIVACYVIVNKFV